jgi:hypothetical protein
MNRKTLSLLLGLTLLGVPAAFAEESLEEVLSNHYEAIGGAEKWKALENCRMTGIMIIPQTGEAPFSLTYGAPSSSRLEVTFQGMTRVQAYDGEVGWVVVPGSGSTEPQLMPDEFLPIMKEQSDFAGPLVDWEAKGHLVELVGKEEIDGVEAYHLEVTLESGDLRHFFLDGDSYLLMKIEATTEFMGNELEVETVFSDFREVGGLVMPHSVKTGPAGEPEGQVMEIETIELDLELEDDLFSFPESSEDQDQDEAAE